MSYAIIGFGNIGPALAKAFARKGVEVSVATTRDPQSFASAAAAIGPTIIAKTLAEAIKADIIFWPFVSRRTRMSRRRCPIGRARPSSM
jgi:predicted dinucleotide-binding enzyme